jgi:hypothetical protein
LTGFGFGPPGVERVIEGVAVAEPVAEVDVLAVPAVVDGVAVLVVLAVAGADEDSASRSARSA